MPATSASAGGLLPRRGRVKRRRPGPGSRADADPQRRGRAAVARTGQLRRQRPL
jgi:hypothetical protein